VTRRNDGPTVWSTCTIDALGLGRILGRATRIRSTDPQTGDPVNVDIRGDQPACRPRKTVVFIGASDDFHPRGIRRLPWQPPCGLVREDCDA